MASKNSGSLTNCYSCNSCDYCYYCYSCDYCVYCYSCNSCVSCYSCNYCDSCDYCYYCYSCNSCVSCYSCDYCYSCYSCRGLRMSEKMLFCLGEGITVSKGAGYQKNNMVFNVQVTPTEFDKIKLSVPTIKLPVTRWVDKDEMTDKEKKDVSVWKEIGGYLKTMSYEEAWAIAWGEMDKKDRDSILAIPQFNSEIFESITGIKVANQCNPKEIIIDGATYVLKTDGKE